MVNFVFQDTLEYRKKMRVLKVRMLDGAIKSIIVDDSHIVSNMMEIICTKIGITNHDEYSLVRDKAEDEEKGLGGEDPRQTPAKETSKETTIVRGLSLRNVLPHRVVVIVVTLVARSCGLGCGLDRGLWGSIGVLLGDHRSSRGPV